MPKRKKILVIIGSASSHSSNHKLVDYFIRATREYFNVTIANDLKSLPHFDPELSAENPPPEIIAFRDQIQSADGVLISTPEYIFSIPAGLKNAIEWCVATTIFTDKPVGIITASAHGQKGHDELQMILKTVMAKLTPETSLLIQGIKGKVNSEGKITDNTTFAELQKFFDYFKKVLS